VIVIVIVIVLAHACSRRAHWNTDRRHVLSCYGVFFILVRATAEGHGVDPFVVGDATCSHFPLFSSFC
jgi:hypothetical protein